MRATHEAELDIPALPKAARHIYIVPELGSKTLLSVSQLCQADCQVIFHEKAVTVHYKGKVVLKGAMTDGSKLWQMEIPTAIENERYLAANAAIHFNTAAEIVKFMHAAMGYPTLTTLHKALANGWVQGLPGLTQQTLRNYPPFSGATIKGHMTQIRKNVRSTKDLKTKSEGKTKIPHSQIGQNPNHAHNAPRDVPTSSHNDPDERANSERQSDNQTDDEDDNDCGNKRSQATIFRPPQKAHSDQTGEFVCQSTAKNKYVYLLYDYASNHIFAEPIQSTLDADITRAFDVVIKKLKAAGNMPENHMLDNQCGKLQIAALEKHGIKFQIVPPGMHRRNAAERAIRTFKDHFISILCRTDSTFPLKIWDKLIPQATLTLNLMRMSRMDPKKSAYAQIYGPFDYNATPIAPLGYRILVHVKPHLRGSWDPKAEEGFYIGPAPKHYRCVLVYITETATTRVSDTVTWVPENTGMPKMAPSDDIVVAIKGLQTGHTRGRPYRRQAQRENTGVATTH
jgi:hypothetical protein